LLDESVVPFVVTPFDLDGYLHLNNGRYLSIMDTGRLDLMVRNGMVRASLKHRWQPVVAGATIRFKRTLAPFSLFRLRTRLLCWDGDSLFVESLFEKDGRIASRALVRMAVIGEGSRKVPISEITRASGYPEDSPPMPPELAAWHEWETLAVGRKGPIEEHLGADAD